MSKLPIISPKDLVKILGLLDFSEIRQNGSHRIYQHKDGRTAIVPFHGEDIGRGLLRKILNEIEITIDEYLVLKKKV
jgi:predicted RNA binding protein YcfA (HicA-like mRNA interferase family)